jgi:hypothetical protein
MSLGVLLSIALVGAQTHRAMADDAPGLFTRVRSTQRFVIALIREGYERSPIFRELVDTLQQSNIIVFVQPATCAGGRIRSCLTSVNGSAMERHIRISVDTRTSHNALIATMAHELQHAVEIAEHPEVVDATGALRLYRQLAVGRCRDGLSEECETTRALATETQVLNELFGRTRESGTPGAEQTLADEQRQTDLGMCEKTEEKGNCDVRVSRPPPMTLATRLETTNCETDVKLCARKHPARTCVSGWSSRNSEQTRTDPTSPNHPRQALDHGIGVRIPASQPTLSSFLSALSPVSALLP